MADGGGVWSGYGTEHVPERRCPNCGRVSRTPLAKCPHCDRRFDRRLPWLTDPMRRAAAGAGVVAVITGCVLILPGVFLERDQGNARRAAESESLRLRKTAELIREQAPKTAKGEREPRRASAQEKLAARLALVGAAETAILGDAIRRFNAGRLDGPVRGVECGPLIRDANREPDHEVLEREIGRYDCVAVEANVRRGGETVGLYGHPYVAAIVFRTGAITFCKDNKAQSERGKALAQVRLKPACFGLPPDAEPLSNGYVMPPE